MHSSRGKESSNPPLRKDAKQVDSRNRDKDGKGRQEGKALFAGDEDLRKLDLSCKML
jgi:hypothetical protein